ncbi:hypothetical protein LDENG_00259200 [Lucifuga dentata]|nr:hypothetical protein LDENG_00259200 [Lucifuga dentata]
MKSGAELSISDDLQQKTTEALRKRRRTDVKVSRNEAECEDDDEEAQYLSLNINKPQTGTNTNSNITYADKLERHYKQSEGEFHFLSCFRGMPDGTIPVELHLLYLHCGSVLRTEAL